MTTVYLLAGFAVFVLVLLYCTKKQNSYPTSTPTPTVTVNEYPSIMNNPKPAWNGYNQQFYSKKEPDIVIQEIPKNYETPQEIKYKSQWGNSGLL